jgi:glycosyltransferase involved in cell wall biosynthesis
MPAGRVSEWETVVAASKARPGETRAHDILERHATLRSIFLLRPDIGGSSSMPSDEEIAYFLLWAIIDGRHRYHGIVIDADYFDYVTAPVGGFLSRLEAFAVLQRKDNPGAEVSNAGAIHVWYYAHAVRNLNLEIFVTGHELQTLAALTYMDDTPDGRISLYEKVVHEVITPQKPAFDLKRPADRRAFKRWLSNDGPDAIPDWLRIPPSTPTQNLSGVNLFGFAEGMLGIGEDVRALAKALQQSGIPIAVCNIALSERYAKTGQSNLASFFVDRPIFPTNIFCVTAFETERARVLRGPHLFAGRYNIGYWPWELSSIPPYWCHVFDNVDEIWAMSHFLEDAYKRQTTKPVTYMPPYVNVDRVERVDRAAFGLEADDFVFLVMFDFNSFVSRKNPAGAITAFRRAFKDKSGRERLLIKTINGHIDSDSFDKLLKEIAHDSRIVLVDGPLTRPQICGLISAVDCFVSLHRAEGFGRVIAEAMFLGTPVIATDWSGSQSFLNETNGFPVACTLRPLKPGEYAYEEGSQWAEPDLDDATATFRAVRKTPAVAAARAAAAKRRIETNFGLEAVAQGVAKRLAVIGRRQSTANPQ